MKWVSLMLLSTSVLCLELLLAKQKSFFFFFSGWIFVQKNLFMWLLFDFLPGQRPAVINLTSRVIDQRHETRRTCVFDSVGLGDMYIYI